MISVIIPTYKEPEYLDLCLESLTKGQVKENEIIVVVDGYLDINKKVLDRYPNVRQLIFEENRGLAVATNWGVYNATNEYILVVNDDNVFPDQWDVNLRSYLGKGKVVTPNQIEPNPSMFKQFQIEDIGKTPKEFSLEVFWEYEKAIRGILVSDYTGSTLPFAMYKYDYLAVGGWDELYSTPHVVDWDFFLKCEYVGYRMIRTYNSYFYHFAGAATKQSPEQARESRVKEIEGHRFFENKWDNPAQHNPENNSKMLSTLKDG